MSEQHTQPKAIDRKALAMLASDQFSALRALGYSASDLRALGYSASALRAAAGYSASDLRALGYSASDLRAAGYSASDLEQLDASVPLLERPYSRLLADIQAQKRRHKQSTWGPEESPTPEANLCNTPMCTAGHLVSLGGAQGWALKEKHGWAKAAALIHFKAHPDHPPQNFGNIPDDWATAYIEEMAAVEDAAEQSQ